MGSDSKKSSWSARTLGYFPTVTSSAKEIIFLVALVCLSVNKINKKIINEFTLNFMEGWKNEQVIKFRWWSGFFLDE